MSASLNAESFMECARHGQQRPAFMCQHLLDGERLGFFQPDDPPTADEPWEQAWCEACELIRMRAGGWNDESESFAAVKLVCHGCFQLARARNIKHKKKQLSGWLSNFFKVHWRRAE